MTIEEKIEKILKKFHEKSLANFYGDGLTKATQAILALIKPMSRERMIEIMREYSGPQEIIVGKDQFGEVADAILAEWGEGLK